MHCISIDRFPRAIVDTTTKLCISGENIFICQPQRNFKRIHVFDAKIYIIEGINSTLP